MTLPELILAIDNMSLGTKVTLLFGVGYGAIAFISLPAEYWRPFLQYLATVFVISFCVRFLYLSWRRTVDWARESA